MDTRCGAFWMSRAPQLKRFEHPTLEFENLNFCRWAMCVNQSERLRYVTIGGCIWCPARRWRHDAGSQIIKLGSVETKTALIATLDSTHLACETHETHNTLELSGEFKHSHDGHILLNSVNKTYMLSIFHPPLFNVTRRGKTGKRLLL